MLERLPGKGAREERKRGIPIVRPAGPFTSGSSKRRLSILALALLAVAYSLTAIATSALTTPHSHSAGASSASGEWLVDSDGGVFSMGGAPFYGSAGGLRLASPIVGMAATPDGGGYWEVASDGLAFSFGDAHFYGWPGSGGLNRPIVGMAVTPDGKGYWEVASDGGVFSFGDAVFSGSTGAIHLNSPIVGMAATPDGGGYWLVASDGGIFSFGDAVFYGSTGAIHLNEPIVGMAPTPDGGGYWLVASDGGVFSFGDAVFYGSTPAQDLAPISAITASPDGKGYVEAATNGALYPHGDATPMGPTAGMSLTQPVVGAAPVSVTISTGGSTIPTTQPPTTTVTTNTPTPTTTSTTAPSTTATTTTTTTTAPPTTSTGVPPSLGVYAGNNNPAGVNSFASATGAHVTMAETYLPWDAYTGSAYGWAYLTTESTLSSWLSNWEGTSDQMVIGVPMVALDGSGNPENTLAEGAAGDENANFVAIAKNLVALGFGNAVLRLGWEFDGTWYPWSVESNADAANFATYWQNVVTSMRSVPGANFKFLWSPAGFQSLSWDINDAYPGNSYVDDVSLDVYDWSWDTSIFSPSGNPNNTATVAQSNAVFSELLTDTEGLNWLASFAQAHDEPIVIPEWAVTIRNDGHGLGDDPTFINNMANWFITNHVAWSIYFIDDTADNVNQGIDFQVTDGNFPNSLAALETDLG